MSSRNFSNEEQAKQNDKRVNIENIKSNYLLDLIFTHMKRNLKLKIMKQNEQLQKRLNLSLKDYKEYALYYSSIEVELTVSDNRYGTFINIPNKEKEYYHIYFDNLAEEIKRNSTQKDEKIKTIKIIIDYQVISFKRLFANCKCINSITFKKFDRINITDMSGMFIDCYSLKELNLTNFNTNSVTNMSEMFLGCSSLTELNLSSFNTKNVTDMFNMFCECKALKELNISNFNTENVTNMYSIFAYCSS